MPKVRATFLLLLFMAGLLERAEAFSLNGPPDTWQVQEEGYQIDASDIFGPMNLGEEYRWNTGTIVYGYDPSFLDYFGQQGVVAIEKAIQLLNALPTMSALSPDLSEFPLDTRRFNHEATSLFVFDLKSWTLSMLLFELGVSPAERWVYTLRAREVLPGPTPVYSTTIRNFDPVTLAPSRYINGTLYSFVILQTYAAPDVWEAVDFNVDPNAASVTTVSSLGIDNGTLLASGFLSTVSPGMFFTGLTRDDVGALRYIYNKANLNTETLPPNSSVSPGGGGPWGVPGGGTNVVTNAVAQALRPGIDKFTLVRQEFDSLLGQWNPITNRYTDTFITNGAARSQTVERILLAPDILFGAQDLGTTPNAIPVFLGRTVCVAPNWVSNDAINGQTPLAGPGQIQGTIGISFSTIGPWFLNTGGGSEEDTQLGFVWGHYDGSTNPPVVFPNGTSIRQIEQQVFGSSRGSPWTVP